MTSTKTAPRGALISLFVIATAQLMLVLDDSIVNIALPAIQRSLHVTPVNLPWIVNAYILAFGALLLLGGRLGADCHPSRNARVAAIKTFCTSSGSPSRSVINGELSSSSGFEERRNAVATAGL